MATETRTTGEREEAQAGFDDAASDERTLGRLEGQMSILLRNVEDQGRQLREDSRQAREDWRQAREDYRALDAKMDSMNTKIDSMNTRIDSVNARIDKLFYWILGLCVAIIIAIVGSALGLALRLSG